MALLLLPSLLQGATSDQVYGCSAYHPADGQQYSLSMARSLLVQEIGGAAKSYSQGETHSDPCHQ